MKRQTNPQKNNKIAFKHLPKERITMPKLFIIHTTHSTNIISKKNSEANFLNAMLSVTKLVKDVPLAYDKAIELMKEVQGVNYEELIRLDNQYITFHSDIPKIREKLIKQIEGNEKSLSEYKKLLTTVVSKKEIEEEKYRTVDEYRSLLKNQVSDLKAFIDASNKDLFTSSSSIARMKNLLQENKEVAAKKLAEIKSLRETHKNLLVKCNKEKAEQKRLTKAEIMREYVVHRIKGSLYTILISDCSTNDVISIHLNSLEMKIMEEKYACMKFDTIIDQHATDDLNYSKHLLEVTRPMLLSCLGVIKETAINKNLTYLILSAYNQYKILIDYILTLLELIKDLFGDKRSILIEGQLLDDFRKSLITVSDIKDFINDCSSFHKVVVISINGIKVTFVLVDVINYNEDLEFIKVSKELESNTQGLVTKRGKIHKIFNSVQIGYLIVLLDIKELAKKDTQYIESIIEHANSIVDYIQTETFTYLITHDTTT